MTDRPSPDAASPEASDASHPAPDDATDRRGARACATSPAHFALVDLDPRMREQRTRAVAWAADALQRLHTHARRDDVLTVRVFVHVVHNPARPHQNVTDEQIAFQLAALDRDFDGSNVVVGNGVGEVPPDFAAHVGDPAIRFRLEGVRRVETDKASFDYCLEEVKSDGAGGSKPVDPDSMLNLWVCNLGGLVNGYAHYPGAPASLDGVVIHYRCFGWQKGPGLDPFHLGRTGTHEVGHYLDLQHVWGTLPWNSCTDDDFVADTPIQLGPNTGSSNTFPKVSCGNGPHGDMFMNYMDYVDDVAMAMFTKGQVARMRAALLGPRSGVLG